MRLLETPLARLALPIAFAALACCAPTRGADAPPPASDPASASASATVRIPIGDVALETDYAGLDEKMGGAFVPGLRSGANACYVEALWNDPNQKGEIAFEVKPPPGEGRFLVALEGRGSIGKALVACVDGVFGAFYHYTSKPAFDRIVGTLRFEPRWISAPPPPTPEEARAALDRSYSPPDIVRITKAVLKSVSEYSDRSSSEVRRRYTYDLELVFRADGYEADCQHQGPYKVFSRLPYDPSRYAGHTCENHPRKAGARAVDTATVVFGLTYYPSVASSWKLSENALLIDDPDHSADEDRFVLLGLSAQLRILLVCHSPWEGCLPFEGGGRYTCAYKWGEYPMGQVTLYLDMETEARMKEAASAAGVSQSRWLADLIRERTVNEWPKSVAALAGAWADMPTAEDLRQCSSEDVPREPF